MTPQKRAEFIAAVQKNELRDMPWRRPEDTGVFDPYKIWISEIMLQQTQVQRVIPKYQLFIKKFPDIKSLALSNLLDVLTVWDGLGYNRRAKYLLDAAHHIMSDHDGVMPRTVNDLQTLPGVGKNTAGAIMVYAHNEPHLFIETNIRTVYIHHFFGDDNNVDDKLLVPLLQQTLDYTQPRIWYWKLMDYGTQLKKRVGNPTTRSRHYVKQSAFEGSRRQLRAAIVRSLLNGPIKDKDLLKMHDDMRMKSVLEQLKKDGMIIRQNDSWRLM